MKRILVVNSTYPQLRHVADALAESGCLSHYVSLYTSTDGPLERLLARVPVLGPAFERHVRKRRQEVRLQRDQVVNTSLTRLVVREALARSPWANQPVIKKIHTQMTLRLDRSIDRVASQLVRECDAVLAVNHCALETFRAAKALGKATFLDYPIGHHWVKSRVMAAEAERWPEYAASWKAEDEDPVTLSRQDEEIRLADRIWIGSDFVKRTFIEQGVPAEKLAILPYGTELGRFLDIERVPKSGPVQCLFAGQVSQRKGASYLLEAFRKPFSTDVRLVLAGGLMVDKSLLPDVAEAVGHVGQSEMDRLYAEADIFVLPTLWEGMPLSILEAMAAGLPIVSTPCGPSQVVRDGVDGFIVPDRDPEAIHAAVERLAKDPELRARMGASGRDRSKQYTWENYRAQCLEELGCGRS
ncbi:MAG: glycosyltransferase family 4 protein [Fimbriimonadaceae bacterium]|nr:glycosyltransferase family 4 protein [Fimbriimonadaceae bacterium]QYK59277.1 MAG: glycosyltransferase family 4 protein [Fimbriimonadaceae bacterium]